MWLINRRHASALVTVVLCCSLVGCYTLLKHPRTGETAEDMDFASCTDCHDSYPYPGPFEPYEPFVDLPPWWYPPVVIVNDGGKQRTIVDREKVERSDDEGLIGRRPIVPPLGVTPGTGVSTPPVGGTGQTALPPAAGSPPAIIKRQAPPNESGTRSIENKKVEKESNQGSRRSDETKEKK